MPTPRVKPLYEIEKISAVKKLTDPDRDYVFAELNLDGKTLRYCMSSPTSQWRVSTLFTKEPGTLDWLHSFRPDDVYVDIGANVGMYALYAGVIMGTRVYAFEPESQNYAELCRSIFLNAAHEHITAFCAALGDKPIELSRLLLNSMGTGGSFHDFGTPSRNYAVTQRFAQGSVGFSLDTLVEMGALPPPDHIKIDVDGHETKVIAGMQNILRSGKLRTLLLECDPKLPGTHGVIQQFLGQGWVYNPDQVRLSSHGLRPAEAVVEEIRQGAYAGNIIFSKRVGELAFATRALQRFSESDLEQMRLSA
ncbi:MAG: FkbM family methyltransferase [Proteobacteria bacterium]|nr:FkbM family methyltransferase [Pseudomonadota bacterium]